MFANITRGAKLNAHIKATAKKYATVKQAMHNDAISALIHAGETGDCRPMNAVLEWMTLHNPRYAQAFKLWVDPIIKEVDKDNPWIKFTKKEGFRVVKKEDNPDAAKAREVWASQFADQDSTDMYPAFYEQTDKEEQPFDMTKLYEMILANAKRIDKKAEDNELEIPADIKTALSGLVSATTGHVGTA